MRWLMWFCLGTGAGVLWSASGTEKFWPFLLAGALTISLLLLLTLRRMKLFRCAAVILLGFALGISWFQGYRFLKLDPVRKADGKILTVTAEVADNSYETRYGSAAECLISMDGRIFRTVLYLRGKQELEPGDRLTGDFQFRLTTREGKQGATHHQGKGIFLLGYQRGKMLEITDAEPSLSARPTVLRNRVRTLISACLDAREAGFAQALLLGDSTGLDYGTDTALKVSGIRHIAAVSGLHISILFSVLYLILGNRGKVLFFAALPMLTGFAAIAGFTPSVVRACLMLLIFLFANLVNREYDPLTALALAGFFILLNNPYGILSAGFQLSFGCVSGILLFSRGIQKKILAGLGMDKPQKLTRSGKILRMAAGSVSVSLGASVFTIPLAAWYFQTVSLIGIFSNLLLLPVISLLFYGLLAMVLLGGIWLPLGSALGWILAPAVKGVVWIAKGLARMPLAAVYTESPYIVMWLVFVYAAGTLYLATGQKFPVLAGTSVLFGLCISLLLSWMTPLVSQCRMTVLDIGQGQCILLHARDKTFLVDCGGSRDRESADLASETLLSRGISHLDGIIVTHFDQDHIGGVPLLLSRIDTDFILAPYETPRLPVSQSIVSEPLEFDLGSAVMTVFPSAIHDYSNDESLAVLFQTENCGILITGDRSDFGEKSLIDQYELPDVDVLIAGHHGSKTSTCQPLLDAVTPEVVIISCGLNNSYGHPAGEVLQRLEQFGCRVYRTDLQGTIEYVR